MADDELKNMLKEWASGATGGMAGKVKEFWEKPLVENPALDKGIKGAGVLFAAWMLFSYGAQLLCNVVGFVYPAYMSIKAVESTSKSDDTQWLTYWVVFSFFSVGEVFSDVLVGWIPFYWIIKTAFLLWCMSPMNGSGVIYHKVIRPYFLKHEGAIDDAVRKGTEGLSKLADSALDKAKDAAAEQQLRKDN